tara:strand:- start:13049 stop:18325 length:5277 start_codon:yes stop_codon:yes gene_type:complete
MVHKKYIKRGGKIFGPYLYENYRENGVTKTRYLGKPEKKQKKGYTRLVLNITFIVLLVFLLSTIGLFLLDREQFLIEDSEQGLKTYSPISFLSNLFFTTSSPLNVFVNVVDNSDPEFFNVPVYFEVCENKKLLESEGGYDFYVEDEDGKENIKEINLAPLNPFYFQLSSNTYPNRININLFSRFLTKEYVIKERVLDKGWADYGLQFFVEDKNGGNDFVNFNVVVIEVNNAPEFEIPVQTLLPEDLLYTLGDESRFYYDLGDYLKTQFEETSTSDLIFDLTYANGSVSPFSLEDGGIVNITGNRSYIPDDEESWTYHLNLTVQDTGLDMRDEIHENIENCYNFGGNEDPKSWSSDFYLTITKENRALNITSYYPLKLNFTIPGTEALYFNLTARDPDQTPLNVKWYVDEVVEGSFSGLKEKNVSEFEYLFGCGVSGEYKIKGIVTDGLANDSIEWNISVENVACSVSSPSGGGGGSSGVSCKEKWGCGEWMQCQNLEELVSSGWTSKETDLLIKERCEIFNWEDSFCGFQQKICGDFNYCKTENEKPPTIKECYYTVNPSCEDGIKNCHEDSCEVLADCGGPCEACPTCKDNIKNQDEERTDCGGSNCKECIEMPLPPRIFKGIVTYSFIFLLIFIFILLIMQIIKYTKGKEIFKASTIKNKLIRGDVRRKVISGVFIIGFILVLLFVGNFYITNVSQANKIVSSSSNLRSGVLASYGLINGLFNALGDLIGGQVFFIGLPVTNGNTRLEIWDDTEIAGRIEISGDNVTFYANYTDNNDPGSYAPLSTGQCDIRFEDANNNYGPDFAMAYNSLSELFEYNRTFDYKGNYNFEVDCLYLGTPISNIDDFEITNSIPRISLQRQSNWIDFDGINSNEDLWPCIEDVLCYYDFSENVTDADTNDVLTYSVEESNTTLTNYILDPSTGLLEIDVTNGAETGVKEIQLGVIDDEIGALVKWGKLKLDIQEINDAPEFLNLENTTLIVDDEFTYNIRISDEDGGAPYVFNIDFIKCSEELLGNCDLFDETGYSVDSDNGILGLKFTPTLAQAGVYEINFSVMDYNTTLGNSSSSKVVNFTVGLSVWNEPLVVSYLLDEGDVFYLNLSKNVSTEFGAVNFSNAESFPSLNITRKGILDFIPDDADVGFWIVDIFATNPFVSAPKTFDFTINNKNDSLSFPLQPLQANYATVIGPNVEALENAEVELILFIEDNDLVIDESQKATFYYEKINLSVKVVGPNISILNFVFDTVIGNKSLHVAEFIPLNSDLGEYNISLYAEDANNYSRAYYNFTMNILDRDYDIPNITYPGVYEFNLQEGVESNITFRANHSAQDEKLIYRIYVNGTLRDSFLGYGNNTNVTWKFTPLYTDEIYGNKTNITLVVLNQNLLYSDLIKNKTWEMNITHNNAPVKFTREILNKTYPVNFLIKLDLKDYFLDEDYLDQHYNQNFSFNIFSNPGIYTNVNEETWELFVSSTSELTAVLNITLSDINLTNSSKILTSDISNDFEIEFVTDVPEIVTVEVPVPSPSSGGSSRTKVVSLKIITPSGRAAEVGDILKIPLQLSNTGGVDFRDIILNSSALRHGETITEVETSFDMNSFQVLKPNQKENITLTLFFNTEKLGEYEILINVESKYPKYKDWAKIHIDLQAINESQVKDLIVFTEEFIINNPSCVEITEIIRDAEKYLQNNDYINAKIKTEEALNSCKQAISQVSVPRTRFKYFRISIYFVSAIILAIILGLIYYLIKRRQLRKLKPINIQKKEPIKRF